MKEVKCPLCGEKIYSIMKPWVGMQVICPACEADLEIVGLNPVSLDWPYDDTGYIEYDSEEEKEGEYE